MVLACILLLTILHPTKSNVLWYYSMNAAIPTPEWALSSPTNRITEYASGEANCPGIKDYCWSVQDSSSLTRTAISTAGYQRIRLTYSVNIVGTDGSNDQCSLYYTTDGDTTNYLTINTWTADTESVNITYNAWTGVDNNAVGISIILFASGNQHECYYNELSLQGDLITNPPSKTPTETPVTPSPTTFVGIKSLSTPLNINHLSDNGAVISILKDVNVTIQNDEWLLKSLDEIGFNMLLELDTSWAFSSSISSNLSIIVNSAFGRLPTQDLVVAFSQTDSQYFAVNIEMDGDSGHDVYPDCYTYTYASGDIHQIVSTDTGDNIFDKALPSGQRGPLLPNDNTPTINYPLTFILENYPNINEMHIRYDNPGQDIYKCFYNRMLSDVSLKIYFAGEFDGVYIQTIDVIHRYDGSVQPTNAPINTQPSSAPTTSVPTTSVPSENPTLQPTSQPTINPTQQPTTNPTEQPTDNPSRQPTSQPTINPTQQPTNNPTQQPSTNPTPQPSSNPSSQPTSQPTVNPTPQPTDNPIAPGSPTSAPTPPTNNPTSQPTSNPTSQPTDNPTMQPTDNPTMQPTTDNPTAVPTDNPTQQPTNNPTALPTTQPTSNPSSQPTSNPTMQPTIQPTTQPTDNPTSQPTDNPTSQPTDNPTTQPTSNPTSQPTQQPTDNPVTNIPTTVNPITIAPTYSPQTGMPTISESTITTTIISVSNAVTRTDGTEIENTKDGLTTDNDGKIEDWVVILIIVLILLCIICFIVLYWLYRKREKMQEKQYNNAVQLQKVSAYSPTSQGSPIADTIGANGTMGTKGNNGESNAMIKKSSNDGTNTNNGNTTNIDADNGEGYDNDNDNDEDDVLPDNDDGDNVTDGNIVNTTIGGDDDEYED